MRMQKKEDWSSHKHSWTLYSSNEYISSLLRLLLTLTIYCFKLPHQPTSKSISMIIARQLQKTFNFASCLLIKVSGCICTGHKHIKWHWSPSVAFYNGNKISDSPIHMYFKLNSRGYCPIQNIQLLHVTVNCMHTSYTHFTWTITLGHSH